MESLSRLCRMQRALQTCPILLMPRAPLRRLARQLWSSMKVKRSCRRSSHSPEPELLRHSPQQTRKEWRSQPQTNLIRVPPWHSRLHSRALSPPCRTWLATLPATTLAARLPAAGSSATALVSHTATEVAAPVHAGNASVPANLNLTTGHAGGGIAAGLAVESSAAGHPGDSHRTLLATPTALEVGVQSGTQGWLKIRAESERAGRGEGLARCGLDERPRSAS